MLLSLKLSKPAGAAQAQAQEGLWRLTLSCLFEPLPASQTLCFPGVVFLNSALIFFFF